MTLKGLQLSNLIGNCPVSYDIMALSTWGSQEMKQRHAMGLEGSSRVLDNLYWKSQEHVDVTRATLSLPFVVKKGDTVTWSTNLLCDCYCSYYCYRLCAV